MSDISSGPDDPHKDIQARYFRSGESIQAAVFLFHGRGGNAQSIQQQLGQYIAREGVALIIPEAHTYSWYPFKFNEQQEANQPWQDSAINWTHREVNRFIEAGLKPSQIVFGGFSQGACMALEYPMRYPQRYGGAFCLSGGVIGREGSRQSLKYDSLKETPVFLGCADEDQWVPRSKFDESIRLLSESGANVKSRMYKGLGHNVCEDEIESVKAMIDQVLNP